jgi:hypothetical protein
MENEVVVACFKILLRNLPGWTVKNQKYDKENEKGGEEERS